MVDFEQNQTCQIVSVQWVPFPVKTDCNTQWVPVFSMNFNDFSTSKSISNNITIAHLHAISINEDIRSHFNRIDLIHLNYLHPNAQ